MLYFGLKFLHVIGACVLLGTGAGIAFFMLAAHLRGHPAIIAGVARIVVRADFIFTATAVILQPLTGFALIWTTGYSPYEHWIELSLALYVLTGLFWTWFGFGFPAFAAVTGIVWLMIVRPEI